MPPRGPTEGQTNPSQGPTFRVGADEDPDAAAGGHEVSRQGGEVPGESRPPERGVPGAGQPGARAARPHRPWEARPPPPPPSAPRAPAPRRRGTARSVPAAQSRAEPPAPAASTVAHAAGRRAAAMRTLALRSPPPSAPPGVRLARCRSRAQQPGEREGGVPAATCSAPLGAGKSPRPSPRPRPRGRRGLRGGGAARRGAEQTFSIKGARDLSEAASHG